ncbi:MAG TPA: AbrB/MazE/SpoVT family DNA-binding domain-containing protein [Candidatus Dormibacteraeota bacterium]|nr:AbrB/MazE/SpoVT family DNA-binding domain-containing protein [Candidatus Dormibacteraeota bacterium]
MSYITTLTKNGQMTLPKPIRDRLRAEPGTQLKVEWQEGRAIIQVQYIDERLKQLRENSITHLKQHGLYGLSDKELKKGIEKKRVAYYGQKYRLS